MPDAKNAKFITSDNVPRAASPGCAILMICLVTSCPSASPAQPLPPVSTPTATTVGQDVFRFRYTGRQADVTTRAPIGQAIEPEGYVASPDDPDFTTPEALGMTPLFDVASPFRRGLAIGPVDVNVNLSLGWEYSSRSSSGTRTEKTDDNSPFAAPAVLFSYNRAVGPWAVNASYSAGYRYYVNPDYQAEGSGSQRNPLSQSASILVGHLGARHEVNFTSTGSFGTGFDVNAGNTLTQTQLSTGLDWEYLLAQFYTVGADAAYRTTISSDDGNGQGGGNGNLSAFDLNTYADYLWTGKTTLRLSLGTGQNQQSLRDQEAEDRTYVQSLFSVNYRPKSKFVFDAGLGVGYVTDSGGSQSTNSELTGLRPVYQLGVLYQATEKTSVSAEFRFQGADIRPDFRLQADWQPRDSTAVSLAIYQDQGFSLTTRDQIQVSRGIVGSVSQRIFSRVTLSVSGGWQQTENVSLGSDDQNSSNGENTFAYSFASTDLSWQIRDWVAANASIYTRSGSDTTSDRGNEPETRASISIDFSL